MSTDATPTLRVIGEIPAHNARIRPHAEAVVDGERRVTWSVLAERVARLSNALLGTLDIAPGDRVAFLGENCLEGFELMYAAPLCGVIAVPLNDRLADRELAGILRTLEPRALVHTTAAADRAGALAEACDVVKVRVGGTDAVTYDGLLEGASAALPAIVVDPDSVSSICFTSGTTGTPKGVMMRNGAQMAFARAETAIEPVRPGACHLYFRQLAVAPGHRIAAWHGLLGGCTVITPTLAPEAFFDLVEREEITNVLLSPTQMRMLIDQGNVHGRDLSSLEVIVYGGAPATPELVAASIAFFPCDLMQAYGGSEAGQVLYMSSEDHRAGRVSHYTRTVPGVEIERRDDDGCRVDDDEPGELWVRSPQLMAGYWRDPGKTDEVLRDGWYATGDVAVVEERGIRVAGRRSDMIISGGYNVMPIEVEDALRRHPAVRDAAVFGVPDPLWGEAVHAVVVVHDPGIKGEELIESCVRQLARFKRPRSIRFVDALPLTALGKVNKAVLRREAQATAQS